MTAESEKPASAAQRLLGEWLIETIAERPVIDRSPARIAFGDDGRVAGNASCNRFFGPYTAAGAELTIGSIATTRMMCPPALMEQEQRFLAVLPQVAGYRFVQGLLELTDGDGKILLRASRSSAA